MARKRKLIESAADMGPEVGAADAKIKQEAKTPHFMFVQHKVGATLPILFFNTHTEVIRYAASAAAEITGRRVVDLRKDFQAGSIVYMTRKSKTAATQVKGADPINAEDCDYFATIFDLRVTSLINASSEEVYSPGELKTALRTSPHADRSLDIAKRLELMGVKPATEPVEVESLELDESSDDSMSESETQEAAQYFVMDKDFEDDGEDEPVSIELPTSRNQIFLYAATCDAMSTPFASIDKHTGKMTISRDAKDQAHRALFAAASIGIQQNALAIIPTQG